MNEWKMKIQIDTISKKKKEQQTAKSKNCEGKLLK